MEDFFQAWNRLGAFNFGDHTGLVPKLRTSHIAQLTGHFHVGGIFRKADRHVIGLKAHGRLDIVHVLAGQGGSGQTATLLVDAFVVGQLATGLHGGVNLLTFDRVHGQNNQAIVQEQHVSGLDVPRQLFVIQSHALQVTGFGARGVQHKLGPVLEHDFALGKLAYPDFGAL